MRLVIVNLFYPPDVPPTAHLAASLAEHRTRRGDQVTVVCGKGAYLGGSSSDAPEPTNGTGTSGTLRVARLWTPQLGKATTVRRLGDYLTFFGLATVRLLALPRQDVIVAMTTPPLIVVAAVVHRLVRRRTRVILWCQDTYPDAAEEYGTIRRGSVVSKVLRGVNRWAFRRLDHVVGLDQAMVDRLLSQYGSDDMPSASVIPNWEPLALFPAGAQPPPWPGYDEPDLVDRFVVLYLGNLGYGHPIGTLVDAAARLDGEKVAFLFIGGGVRYPEMEAAVQQHGVGNVLLRDYVPKEETPGVLTGADCALISLDDGSLGIMSPCKLHGNLAMGVPVVYVGPEGTNVDEAIDRFHCGVSIRQGDTDGLVDAIRRLRDDPGLVHDQSRAARQAFEAAYSDERTLPQFDALLDGRAA
ncbi:MAG: glycosyltransferase family 4 protein [Acidimicrobiales bacterium]